MAEETPPAATKDPEAPVGFTSPELDPNTPSPIFVGSTGGLLRKAQVEEFYVITWDSPKEQVFETGPSRQQHEGKNEKSRAPGPSRGPTTRQESRAKAHASNNTEISPTGTRNAFDALMDQQSDEFPPANTTSVMVTTKGVDNMLALVIASNEQPSFSTMDSDHSVIPATNVLTQVTSAQHTIQPPSGSIPHNNNFLALIVDENSSSTYSNVDVNYVDELAPPTSFQLTTRAMLFSILCEFTFFACRAIFAILSRCGLQCLSCFRDGKWKITQGNMVIGRGKKNECLYVMQGQICKGEANVAHENSKSGATA